MKKYRKKPVVVEAEQWKPEMKNWPGKGIPDSLGVIWEFDSEGNVCNGIVTTIHEQETNVTIGDWVIKEPDGKHHYPCKPGIFVVTYEEIKEAPAAHERDTMKTQKQILDEIARCCPDQKDRISKISKRRDHTLKQLEAIDEA